MGIEYKILSMKKSFSQRYGYKDVRQVVQTDSFDKETVNKLWDVISETICKVARNTVIDYYPMERYADDFLRKVWADILEKPIDETPPLFNGSILSERVYNHLKTLWFHQFIFSDKMDFIEILSRVSESELLREQFNNVFRRLIVGYRIDNNGTILKIDSEEEFVAIKEATEKTLHIQKASNLLFDRKNPDYRQSIKESILAVEEVCVDMTGEKNFDKTIEKMSEPFNLHSQFVQSLKNMYGFASDEKGIRHKGSHESIIDFEEAKFILVLCSGIVNYLIEKKVKMNK